VGLNNLEEVESPLVAVVLHELRVKEAHAKAAGLPCLLFLGFFCKFGFCFGIGFGFGFLNFISVLCEPTGTLKC